VVVGVVVVLVLVEVEVLVDVEVATIGCYVNFKRQLLSISSLFDFYNPFKLSIKCQKTTDVV